MEDYEDVEGINDLYALVWTDYVCRFLPFEGYVYGVVLIFFGNICYTLIYFEYWMGLYYALVLCIEGYFYYKISTIMGKSKWDTVKFILLPFVCFREKANGIR